MIIFGLGSGKLHDFGPTLPVTCARCHNRVMYHYASRTRWFRLYFIPVIPLSRTHMLMCPICSNGAVLNREDVARVKALNAVALQYEAKAISDEEFQRAVAAYGQGQVPELPVSALPPVDAASRTDRSERSDRAARGAGPAMLEPVPVAVGPPSGWYPDPSGAEQLRWWDGKGWTDHVKPLEAGG